MHAADEHEMCIPIDDGGAGAVADLPTFDASAGAC